jgi:hypothetical protein
MHLSIVFLALATECLAAVVATLFWFKVRTKAILYFSLFVQLDFLKSAIGIILGMNGIENLQFYNVFGALQGVMLLGFSLSFFKAQKLRNFSIIALVGSCLITAFFFFFAFSPLVQSLVQPSKFFPVLIGFFMLNERLNNHDSRKFQQDPWSIIGFIIIAANLLSLFIIIIDSTAIMIGLNQSIQAEIMLFNALVIAAYNFILCRQLWKLRSISS